MFLLACAVMAQDQDPATAPPAPKPATAAETSPSAPGSAPIDKRAFGVLPNYRTADGNAAYQPISAKRKLWIGFKDSFDYPVYFTSAIFAGINHLEDTSPQFGEGVKGYAKRYVASYADQTVGNMMTESFFPIMFKQDPRYFRVGPNGGGTMKRVGYALSRVLICRSDTGKSVFNISEIGGNSTAVAVSNFYYSDNRNAGDNIQKLGIQIGTDALSNVLKEFWPDIKQRFFKKKPQGD
jgi:hypothetical protein